MKHFIFLSLLLSFLSCNTEDNSGKLNEILAENQKLILENEHLQKIIEELKYPASDRYKQVLKLISENKFQEASAEINLLKELFPKSEEAQLSLSQEKIIDDKIEKQRIEEDRIKALGFKALTDNMKFKIDYLAVSVNNFKIANTFTFDSYDDSYHYKTADRGNKYISSQISITSENNNPLLPEFYAYTIEGDKLIYYSNFLLRFTRWEDYGTYLGNYNDNRNDFSKTATISFKIGVEVKDDIANAPLVILVKNENCQVRNYERLKNPPVYYTSSCSHKKELTIENLKNEYIVVAILNKSKI